MDLLEHPDAHAGTDVGGQADAGAARQRVGKRQHGVGEVRVADRTVRNHRAPLGD